MKRFFLIIATMVSVMPMFAQVEDEMHGKDNIPVLGQTCKLSSVQSLRIRKFDGKKVSWNKAVMIPAGEHDFVVDYKWNKSIVGNKVEHRTSNGITVRYNFEAGHEYTMMVETDEFRRMVRIIFKDNTDIAEQRAREDIAITSDFLANLPKETTEPTRFEGTWKVPKDWGTQFSYISFKGNTWQYSPGYNSSDGEKGIFVLNGDTFRFFRLFKQQVDEKWVPDNDYRNAVSEYRFVFETDGGFRLITIKGFPKRGTFYKE